MNSNGRRMGLAAENHKDQSIMPSPVTTTTTRPHEYNAPNPSTGRSVVENLPSEGDHYLAHIARATNDAVRDWNVTAGSLSWPQGFETLFGYDDTLQRTDLTFWQQRVHPADCARLS